MAIPLSLFMFFGSLWLNQSPVLGVAILIFVCTILMIFSRLIQVNRQERIIACRLWIINGICVREMENLLALMKLYESRLYENVDDYRDVVAAMTRLRSFLKAMEFLDLTDKIYELRDLSDHLNRVTKRLVRSPPLKTIDLIRTWKVGWIFYSYLVSVPSNAAPIELDDVKSIFVDLRSTATRLNSIHWRADTLFKPWATSEDAQNLIDTMEEVTRGIQSSVKTLQKKADLPDFGSVAVVSCWTLGVLSTPDEEIGLRPEHSPIDSKLRPRILRQVDERQLGGLYEMEQVNVNDVDENGVYRGVCKLCIKVTTKDGTQTANGTGLLINNSAVVTAAHNLYNPLNDSYASKVKVEVGVTKGSYRPPEMQWGDLAAIHWGFYAAGKRQNDVAIIKLKSPFHKVVPILYAKAPLVETECSFLRVVGYPGNRGGIGEHRGRIMHVSEGAHAGGWDLKSTNYILRHHLDTVEGHSGCPLLKVGKDAGFEAIAVHAGEGGVVDKSWNEAAPLGHNGNHIEAFAESFRMMEDGDEARHIPGSRIEEVQAKIPGLKKVTIPL